MENATKALIMAGGVLLSMLIIALVIFARSKISDVYNQNDDLAEISDLSKFNEQFTQYERNNVFGYEIISLANRVVDYNFRYSNADGAENDQNYNIINLIIEMPQDKVNAKISYDGAALVFTRPVYNTNSIVSDFSDILNNFSTMEKKYGKENIQNLGKSIESVFNASGFHGDAPEYILGKKRDSIRKFKSIIRNKSNIDMGISNIYKTISECDLENDTSINSTYQIIQNNFKDVAYQYYEYSQFKKAKFNCDKSFTTYDSVTGRIATMKFTFTGKIE